MDVVETDCSSHIRMRFKCVSSDNCDDICHPYSHLIIAKGLCICVQLYSLRRELFLSHLFFVLQQFHVCVSGAKCAAALFYPSRTHRGVKLAP